MTEFTRVVGQKPDGTPDDRHAAWLSGTFAPRWVGTRSETIVLGDSVDSSADGWFERLCITSNQKVTRLANEGVGGERTDESLLRISDVIDASPDICIIGAVTNDIGQGIPAATIRANLSMMVSTLRAAGIYVVARNCPPRDTDFHAEIAAHNSWLKEWCDANAIPLLDIHTPLVDVASGDYASGYSDDGIHPNGEGSQKAVDYLIATGLPECFQGSVWLTSHRGDPADIIGASTDPNGVFQGDSNADGLADRWTAYGGAGSFSLAAASDPVRGNWQHVVLSSTSEKGFYADITSGELSAGDICEVTARVALTGTTGGGIRVRVTNAGVGASKDFGPFDYPISGIVRYRFTVVSLTPRVQMSAHSVSGADAAFAQVGSRKVPSV